MKIIFAGTPAFATNALRALVAAGHEIVLVLTQPDRPAGRGMKTAISPVKLLAQQYKFTLLQPQSLKQSDLHARLTITHADVMIVAAYGLILPLAVLNIPRLGCFNIHASLLPRWRGAAPIQWAILMGDKETGITIMQMDQGLDTGAILMQKIIPIAHNETAQTLHDKLAILGAQCIVEGLTLAAHKNLIAVPQDEKTAQYASKFKKIDGEIDWQLSAKEISCAIRAFNPRPGKYSLMHGIPLKIWQARAVAGSGGDPGEIIAIGREGIAIACGNGRLVLEIVQRPGGKKLNITEFIAGHSMQLGDCFKKKND